MEAVPLHPGDASKRTVTRALRYALFVSVAMAAVLLESFLSGAAKGVFDLLVSLPALLLAATTQTRARAATAGVDLRRPTARRRANKVLKLGAFAVLSVQIHAAKAQVPKRLWPLVNR